MCVIVDTNCFANVFSKTSERHKEFEPVLDWILNGKGKLIYGGTKYITELSKAPKYLRFINILKAKKNKVIVVDKEEVDEEQQRISALITDDDFDDPHLPAIVNVSRCRIICSSDTRSVKFVTDPKLYHNGVHPPVYYTGSRNEDLLCDQYIDDRYKPLNKLNKIEREAIEKYL